MQGKGQNIFARVSVEMWKWDLSPSPLQSRQGEKSPSPSGARVWDGVWEGFRVKRDRWCVNSGRNGHRLRTPTKTENIVLMIKTRWSSKSEWWLMIWGRILVVLKGWENMTLARQCVHLSLRQCGSTWDLVQNQLLLFVLTLLLEQSRCLLLQEWFF